MSIEFKIGADPEFFLIDTETGKHVSAFGMIPGTKHDPFKVEHGAVQVDGMALEFNIDPVTDLPSFHKNIGRVLKQLREMVPARYAFDFSPVAHFGKEYIEAQPDEAKALGCDPDFNAWDNGAINPKPDGSNGIRTASGHIHIGWTQDQDTTDVEHIQACMMLTKQLDYYLGVASLAWDTNSLRRSMYGAPGAFRPKRYGVEYRVLSNAWVNDSNLRTYVYNMSVQGATKLVAGKRVYDKFNSSYIDYLFNQSDWNEISEMVMGPLQFKNNADYDFMQKTLIKNAGSHRTEFLETDEKMKQGWFRNVNTYLLTPYDEVNMELYHEGGYSNPYDCYRSAKGNNNPKPEFISNLEFQSARKKGVKPGEVMYQNKIDHDAFGMIMMELAQPAKKPWVVKPMKLAKAHPAPKVLPHLHNFEVEN